MKKIILIFILCLVQLSFAEKPLKLKVGDLIAKKESGSNYSVSFSVRYGGILKAMVEDIPVSISTEKLVIKGYVKKNVINEKDFLYSQRNVDLNGDHDFNDSFVIKEEKGVYFLNNKKLEILIPATKMFGLTAYNYGEEGNLRINKVTGKGAPFLVYSIERLSGRVYVGLEPDGGLIQVKKFPNPNVQIMIVKETSGILTKEAFSIAGAENFITYTNDKIFPGQDEEWTIIKWIVLPFPIESKGINTFTIKVNDIKPPFAILASANLSYVKSVRLRSNIASSIIKE